MPDIQRIDSQILAALSGVVSIAMLGNAMAQTAEDSASSATFVCTDGCADHYSGGDEQALQNRGATDVNDFAKLIPGLSMSDQGAGNKRYVLRGINSAGAGTVGVYVDEIVITGENSQTGGGLQSDPRLFDVERVEVLKGPQGTTFGSSALSGVVRYIVNKPKLNVFEATHVLR